MNENTVEYKATRTPLFYMTLAMAGLFAVISVAQGISCAVSHIDGGVEAAVAFAVAVVFIVGLAFALKNVGVKTYVFDGNGVTVRRGKKELRRYERRDIKELRYVPFSIGYFLRGRGNGVGMAMCITVVYKNGKYKTLAWFDANIASELKNLYGRFMVIYD